MLSLAAHLPQTVVGLVPDALQVLEHGDLERPRLGVDLIRRPRPHQGQRPEHLAVHVELELPAGGVADAHGRRSLVAG